MTKSLVINGLPRSGTTMLERVFDSQAGILCIGGIFEMVKTIAYLKNLPDKGLIATEDFTQEVNVVSEDSTVALRGQLLSSFFTCLMAPALLGYESAETNRDEIIYGLSAEDAFALTDVIRGHKPASDIGGLMQAMGQCLGLSVFAAKWTLCHRYAPVFLASDNAYWIEIIRNPYARISSGMRYGFDELSHSTLDITRDALMLPRQFEHERYLLLKYEDLCREPSATLEKVSQWLDYEIQNIDIANPLGGAFRGNSSDNVTAGKPSWHQDSSIDPHIGAFDLERWRNHLSPTEIEIINLALDFVDLYPMEHGTSLDRIKAWGRYAGIRAQGAARNATKSAFGMIGLDIVRKSQPSRI